MNIEELSLQQYRNFADRTTLFHQKTAIIGPNGSGKSNLIEAIRLLSIGKSFKTRHLEDLIQFNQLFFRLQARLQQNKTQSLEYFFGSQFESGPKERLLNLDGQTVAWAQFWGIFPTVLFIPNDIEIIIGAPDLRRRYLDSILWQVDANFRHNHVELGRVLKERSTLLFLIKIHRADTKELGPWNELLLSLTEQVRSSRQKLAHFLSDYIERDKTQKSLIKISYQANKVEPRDVLNEEIRLSQNLVGPHRDELEILYKDTLARRFTSRGQARSIIVTLKAAEAEFIYQRLGHTPVILLDDMFSELDIPTSERLFALFSGNYQVIATSITKNALINDWELVELGKENGKTK